MKKLMLLIQLVRTIVEILDDGKVTEEEWEKLTILIIPYLAVDRDGDLE